MISEDERILEEATIEELDHATCEAAWLSKYEISERSQVIILAALRYIMSQKEMDGDPEPEVVEDGCS